MPAPIKPLSDQTGRSKRFVLIISILGIILGVTGYASTLPQPVTAPRHGFIQSTHSTTEPQVEGVQTTDEPLDNEYVAPEDTVEPTTPTDDAIETSYRVVSVSDGDTVKVSINGKTETIRLIGVDTPETVDPRKTVQCFGHQASDFTKISLLNKQIHLRADNTQTDRDKYGRLLRYIFLTDGTNFNLTLIQSGYAFEYTYKVPYQYQKEFKAAQVSANNEQKGLWNPSTCNGKHG